MFNKTFLIQIQEQTKNIDTTQNSKFHNAQFLLLPYGRFHVTDITGFAILSKILCDLSCVTINNSYSMSKQY